MNAAQPKLYPLRSDGPRPERVDPRPDLNTLDLPWNSVQGTASSVSPLQMKKTDRRHFAGGGRATGTGKTQLSGLDALRALVGAMGSAGRGSLATLGGLGGDLTRLGYTLTGNEQPARGTTLFPDSSDMLRRLPNLPPDMRNEAYQSLGQFDPGVLGVAATKGLAQIPKALAHGAESFARAQVPAQVVKGKGGHWLKGSIENALAGLKKPMPSRATDAYGNEVPNVLANSPMYRDNASLNSWIEGPLTKYVKTRMASPDDEVRRLAEEGVLHVAPEQLHAPIGLHSGVTRREFGQSPAAKRWEFASDSFIAPETAGLFKVTRGLDGTTTLSRNPWLADLPNETTIYDLGARAQPDNLGFPHLIDELSNALNPASGLPRNLLLNPEAVANMSMEKAVRRVADINAWRAAQKVEANRALAEKASVIREYPHSDEAPNPKGLRWVQLKAQEFNPANLSEGDKALYADFKKQGIPEDEIAAHFGQDDAPRKFLEDQLKYEGDTMGHCVGGYCDDVLSGRSQIYSLRDAKGEPHVTVEVSSTVDERDYPRELWKQWQRQAASEGLNEEEAFNRTHELAEQWANSQTTRSIKQIKGKQNKAPNPEYLPFVQDFVRNPHTGQPWAEVGDLGNAGLRKLPDNRYITNQQFDEAIQRLTGEGEPSVNAEWFHRQIRNDPKWWENAKGAFEGFAHGGSVTQQDKHWSEYL